MKRPYILISTLVSFDSLSRALSALHVASSLGCGLASYTRISFSLYTYTYIVCLCMWSVHAVSGVVRCAHACVLFGWCFFSLNFGTVYTAPKSPQEFPRQLEVSSAYCAVCLQFGQSLLGFFKVVNVNRKFYTFKMLEEAGGEGRREKWMGRNKDD